MRVWSVALLGRVSDDHDAVDHNRREEVMYPSSSGSAYATYGSSQFSHGPQPSIKSARRSTLPVGGNPSTGTASPQFASGSVTTSRALTRRRDVRRLPARHGSLDAMPLT